MSNEQELILKRALERERAARKLAEKILEDKSAELFSLARQLKVSNKKLERLVQEKTSELKGVFENIVDAYVVIDLLGNVLKMNVAAENLLGYSLDDDIDINLSKLVHKEEVENVSEAFKILYDNGAITDFNVRILTKTGKQKLVHINASIIYDAENNPIAAQGIVRDITKEKEAQEQLIESENRLATLVSNLDSGLLLESEDRKIALTNKKFCDLFGIPVPPEALIGQDCSNAAEETKSLFKDPENFVLGIEELLENRVIILGDELIMASGKILERDYIPIFVNKEYKGHLWAYRDVTLTKRYRKSLEAQREKYSNIIANMNLGLLEVNNDDEILMVNQRFEQMSGYLEHELLGKKGAEILLKKSAQQILLEANNERIKGKSNSYEVTAITKSGEERTWLISGAPNFNINGEVIGSIGVHLDITEMKNLEKQKEVLLRQLEKSNDELQEYAHVVSHDLKSPLRSIYALVDWIKEDNLGKFNEETQHNLTLIENTLEKMEKLISDVLSYSSIFSAEELEDKVNLNTVVNDICDILFIPKHIEIKIKTKLPTIKANGIRMQQLFQNLISNAIRYNNKEKGLIEIDFENKEEEYLFRITDNGMGIKKEYHDKIFQMFQSLTDEKDSSGIGLSIVKKIVTANGGSIWLESKEGEGTTFYFTLKKQ
jgi:PAS domain S-box-containing protein